MHHCLAVSSEFYTEIPDTLNVCLTYVDGLYSFFPKMPPHF